MKLNPSLKFNGATAIIVLSTIFFFTIGPTPSIAGDKICQQNYRSCKKYAKERYKADKKLCRRSNNVMKTACLEEAADEYAWNLTDCKVEKFYCNQENFNETKKRKKKR